MRSEGTYDIAKQTDTEESLQNTSNGFVGTVVSTTFSGHEGVNEPAETMCEMGEVILMERKPAMQIKNPKTPYRRRISTSLIRNTLQKGGRRWERLTVIAAPKRNVLSAPVLSPTPIIISATTHASPLSSTNGAITPALRRFE